MNIMNSNAFQNKAKRLVVDHFNQNYDKDNQTIIDMDDVYVVWFCKTLQNWKALLSTTVPDGKYYEVTYNGDKREAYLDVYVKHHNARIPDTDVL